MPRERSYTKEEAIQSIVDDLTNPDNPLTKLHGPLHGGLAGRHKDRQLALAKKIASAVINEIDPDITEGVDIAIEGKENKPAIAKKYSKEALIAATDAVDDYIYNISSSSGFSISRTELAEMLGFPESGKEIAVPALIKAMVSSIKQNYDRLLHHSSARSLDVHMQDISLLPAERFSKIGKKDAGKDRGALLEKDGEKFMAKFSRDIITSGRAMGYDDDFYKEFLAGPFYNRLMQNRAPRISALHHSEKIKNPFDNNSLTNVLTSKFIPNFRTILDIKEEIHKQFESVHGSQIEELNARKKYFENSIGFEKLMAVTRFLGDDDLKDDNIGIKIDSEGKAEWCKIDHGCSLTTLDWDPISMLKNIRTFLLDKVVDMTKRDEWYAYPFVTMNLDAFLESIKEITRISDKEIEALIKHRVYELKQIGVAPSELPSSSRHDFKDFESAENHYILNLKLQRDSIAKLGAILEVLKSRHPNPSEEWKNGDWIRAEKAIDEIQTCRQAPEYYTKLQQYYDERRLDQPSIRNLLYGHDIDVEGDVGKFLISNSDNIQRLREVGVPFNNIIALNESQLKKLITPASLEFFANVEGASLKFEQLSHWPKERLQLLFEQAQPAYRMGLLQRDEAINILRSGGSIQREVDLGRVFAGTGITKKRMPSEEVIQALIKLPDEELKFLKSHVNLANLTNEDIPVLTTNAIRACKDGITTFDVALTFEKLKQLHKESPEKFHLLFSHGAMEICKERRSCTSFDILKQASVESLALIVSPTGVDFWLNCPDRHREYHKLDAKTTDALKADIDKWSAQRQGLNSTSKPTNFRDTFTGNLSARRGYSSGSSLST